MCYNKWKGNETSRSNAKESKINRGFWNRIGDLIVKEQNVAMFIISRAKTDVVLSVRTVSATVPHSPAARGQKVEVEYVQTFIAVS